MSKQMCIASTDVVALLGQVDLVALIAEDMEVIPLPDSARGTKRWRGTCPKCGGPLTIFRSLRMDYAIYGCLDDEKQGMSACAFGGDAIGYVRQTSGLNFGEACDYLADRVGMKVPRRLYEPPAQEWS